MIDIDYLKQLLSIFDESTVNDLRIDKEGTSIRLTKNPKKEAGETTAYHYMPAPPAVAAPAAAPVTAGEPANSTAVTGTPAAVESAAQKKEAEAKAEAENAASYHTINSPIVGTFYSSPNPESPAFVEVGSEVHPGTVLCIVEAMKLMNEIESDVRGKVVKILVENAQPVEFGQPLFQIEE